MSSAKDPFRVKVLISYAHSDNEASEPRERWLQRLMDQIRSRIPQDMVDVWSDADLADLEAGGRLSVFGTRLQGIKVVVLLVSPAFLASKYIRNGILPALLMVAKQNGATVMPIILRHSLFSETRFKYPDPHYGPNEVSLSVFQPANQPNRPLNTLPAHEQDVVLRRVARLIEMKAGPDPLSDYNVVVDHSDVLPHPVNGGSLADALLVWDPEVVDHADYVALITALGDLVRSQGGIGVERIGHLGVGIPVDEDILV